MRPPLEILDDLRDVLRGLNVLKTRRSKLLVELSGDKTVTAEQVQDFMALAKLSVNDITAAVSDFEALHGGAQN